VENASRELVLADEDLLDRQRSRVFVEARGVRPGDAVDVVVEREQLAVEMLQIFELACSFVDDSVDRDRLQLAGTTEIETLETSRSPRPLSVPRNPRIPEGG